MAGLQHEHIVRLYDSFWQQAGEYVYWVLAMEKCELDLMKEIENRGRNQYPWTEAEMWYYVRCLVDAYAYMQSRSIAHRDIKPHNIFLTFHKAPKVGDLGSSKAVFHREQHTTTGTPLYLSPLLRNALTSNMRAVQHNAYKSDVYSLGLTFLHMAKLSPPVEVMVGDPQMRAARMEQTIASLNYSESLQYLLRCMLADEEDVRPTFVEVWNWLNPAPEQPHIEGNQAEEAVPAIYGEPPRMDQEWVVQANPNAPGIELATIQNSSEPPAAVNWAQPGFPAPQEPPQHQPSQPVAYPQAAPAMEPGQLQPAEYPQASPAQVMDNSSARNAVVAPKAEPSAGQKPAQDQSPQKVSPKSLKADSPKDRCCENCSLF
jgi:serine/threonine protein kinase